MRRARSLILWTIASNSFAKGLPSPAKTWEVSKIYILKPFEKRGEQDQGILRFTWYSLIMVAKGYTLALLIGTPLGFLLGMSKFFSTAFDGNRSTESIGVWEAHCPFSAINFQTWLMV